ncbi:MAG: DUF2490 domain-containing protein [Planctomycetota bacterium]
MEKATGAKLFSIVSLVTIVVFGGICRADVEYWQSNHLRFDLNEDFAITAEEEFRVGSDRGGFYLHNVEAGMVYKSLADWLDAGFSFKKEYQKDLGGKWRHENRPLVQLTFKGRVLDMVASNRIRLEYRDLEVVDDAWRLRNKFTVMFPHMLTGLNLQPYVADEFFIRLDDDNINQNRLYSGFGFNVTENLDLRFYYMWRTGRTSRGWIDVNVIGTKFILRF